MRSLKLFDSGDLCPGANVTVNMIDIRVMVSRGDGDYRASATHKEETTPVASSCGDRSLVFSCFHSLCVPDR